MSLCVFRAKYCRVRSPHTAASHALFLTHGVQTESFNPILKCSPLRSLLNVFVVMNRMCVERSEVTVACLHSGQDLNPLRPAGAVGGFLMFWCTATLHSPCLLVFLNSASTDSLKPSERLSPVFSLSGGSCFKGIVCIWKYGLCVWLRSEVAKCLKSVL